MTPTAFDQLLDRIGAGEDPAPDQLAALAGAHDILTLGMLADALRRRLHGTRVTYLRTAWCPVDATSITVPPAAREVRITGAPETLAAAVAAARAARAAAAERTVSGFSWVDVERLATAAGTPPVRVLRELRGAGLDCLAEIPLDALPDPAPAVEALTEAGFERLRLTIGQAPAGDRTALWLRVAELQRQCGALHAVNPLPAVLQSFRPTTGYEDVKAVALARLAAPNVPRVQVDWSRYGPKLAQVALTFGADDLDGVTALDDASAGRRRAPLEDVRRSIAAAGFSPVERDGRFEIGS